MAIDLTFEADKKLSTQDIYDIINFSIEAADDNGFVNSFIFERALYLFAAIILEPELKDELAPRVAQNINDAWDYAVENAIIEDLAVNYEIDLSQLADQGKIWFDEYVHYNCSARGLLNTIQQFSSDIVQAAAQQLQNSASNSGIQDVLKIADNWGMNNGEPVKKYNNVIQYPPQEDSLFTE